jgi:hypothetical protein
MVSSFGMRALVLSGHVGAPLAGHVEAAAKGFVPRFDP